MKMRLINLMTAVLAVLSLSSCEIVDNVPDEDTVMQAVELAEVAEILSRLPLENAQVEEVYMAVTSSSGNGYDEEYMMKDLFERPGTGVGDSDVKSAGTFTVPLRDLIEDYVYSRPAVRSGRETMDPEAYLSALVQSDIQIYWPYSEKWDGRTMPVITFDPEDGSEVNIGYRMIDGGDGFRYVEEVMVDEAFAEANPVWVVNRNSDAEYASLEMLRREDPEWGAGGGNIIVNPLRSRTGTMGDKFRTLILRDFTMKRNYDS
ncbi:MAG: hypothetical protein II194_08855, partial [Bacteroidales bacterium]|nr:hypothetical protein [Bacteroidales bacterium]